MSQDIETIKSRIAKLLATASNDAATPNEKSVAMQMASALMRRYNLERDDIEDINKKEDYKSVNVNTMYARLTPWEARLAAFVSAYIVKGSWVVSGKEGSTHRNFGTVGQAVLTFVGLGEDSGMAAATFVQLRESLLKQCAVKFGTPVRGSGRSYAVGFVTGLNQVAREAENAEKAKRELLADMSRALMRTDMLKEQSKNWYLSADPTIKVRSSNSSLNNLQSDAYKAGIQDGRKANQSKASAVAGFLN